jgi:hypothetical protein
MSKLKAHQIVNIVKMRLMGGVTLRDLAEAYGVHLSTAWRVLAGETYSRITKVPRRRRAGLAVGLKR